MGELIRAQERLLEKRRQQHQQNSSDEYDFISAVDRIRSKAAEHYGPVVEHEETDEDKWRIAGIPLKYYPESFDTFRGNDTLVRVCQGFVESDENLLLQGKSGRGKTHLAASIVKAKLAQGVLARFTTVIDLIDRIIDSYKTGRTGDVLREYQRIPVLVLDDLAAENVKDHAISRVHGIIDSRLNNCLQTIVTTNLKEGEIAYLYSERLESRLYEGRVIEIINMPDYRKLRNK